MESNVPRLGFSIKDFRRHGHALIDYIADYYESLERESLPVVSEMSPNYLRKELPQNAPEEGEPWEEIMSDFSTHIIPGITHWQSPRFFAYFPANSSFPSLFGDMLCSAVNAISFNWIASPASTELESIVMDWLCSAISLPKEFLFSHGGGGVIQGSASESGLVAILAARKRKLMLMSLDEMEIPRLTAYISDQSHSMYRKGLKVAGISSKHIRSVQSYAHLDGAMSSVDLRNMIQSDIKDGLIPFFIGSTFGTTGITALDDIKANDEIANEFQMWHHVDAAYAGAALVCPEFHPIFEGLDRMDSFCFNAHKWMLTNFDCSCLFTRNRKDITNALLESQEELKQSNDSTVIDYKDWQVPLGRRFRALKLWCVMRTFGLQGIRDHIRRHCLLAKWFSNSLKKHPDFELVVEPNFALVCFRLNPCEWNGSDSQLDDLNLKLDQMLRDQNEIFLVHTKYYGKVVLRLAIGSPLTEQKHVEQAWRCIQNCSTELLKE